MRRSPRLLFAALLLSGCGDEMAQQAKYWPYEAAELFANGRVNQPPVLGTVAFQAPDPTTAQRRPPLTPALLERGRERFDIFCSPCHGRTGQGDGKVARIYVPPPPSYHSERLSAATDEHLFNVITGGAGHMYSYAARVAPPDRWAIVAYIRALQRRPHAEVGTLPTWPQEQAVR
jgi:mono/diheme cytochrome c family protein